MTPRFTPLHDTLHALAEGFAHALVRAVRETSVRELAGTRDLARVPALERGPAPGPRPSAPRADAPTTPSRSARPRRARAAASARTSDPLDLVRDRFEVYAGVAIDDPTALLDGSGTAEDGPGPSSAPQDAPEPPPPSEAAPAASVAAPTLALRPGEELLRAGVGGVVLRRRRAEGAPP